MSDLPASDVAIFHVTTTEGKASKKKSAECACNELLSVSNEFLEAVEDGRSFQERNLARKIGMWASKKIEEELQTKWHIGECWDDNKAQQIEVEEQK